MPASVSPHELVTAAGRSTTTFATIPDRPVTVRDPAGLDRPTAAEIVRRYERNGFCVVGLSPDPPAPEALIALAASLRLGAPFTPPLYTMGGHAAPPVSRISAARNADTPDADHPSFGRTDRQRLHSDGTLQDIGVVKASVLVCETPAAEGGDTILFNTAAAFAELVASDEAAALALATPGTLVRRANINGCTDANHGPAVSVRDGALVCRYSVTATDFWAAPPGVDEDALRRGIDFLAGAARPGSPHFALLGLAAGEAIVLDNTRVAHGRTAYLDSGLRRRCLYRGLYLRHPRPGG
ncbi:taurine catabolism dioxygenase TauD [Streptomyces sp. AJS327]|uniref:TauD/TfdA family dioxygenase n=1 Tax=Streptomyces sp. AJS327 TaxID=2545265 RepID=UPI0015DFFB06|nr:TauD/TfdA family dioxygenase [Streptomyces sp. AJS327]MBA0051193.1 taurine catabolism dioxygenase TauD [Streptomyces sp. AJS327]